MENRTICKTIHQYSSMAVTPDQMRRFQEIAADYSRVKNYVYNRYGGIRGLPKLYPGYTVQNEMTESGLRGQLGLPAVYFYLAIFDALGDIKTQWTRVKNGVLEAVKVNEEFTPQERHYLRFVIKVSSCFENILAGKENVVPAQLQPAYEQACMEVNTKRLDRYLCRQVRKRLQKLHTDKKDGFAITERAYRYGNEGVYHGIYISTKEKRQRIFVPLTDENRYEKQLYIKLKPEENAIEIEVPVEVKIRKHPDYQAKIGLAMGMWQMFTTNEGNVYGERLGELQGELADYMRAGESAWRREREHNPGRIKYERGKARQNARLQAYINQEINRMLRTEKPGAIYLPRLPGQGQAGVNRKINYAVGVWKRGYVRKRLEQKCRENQVELIEGNGKGYQHRVQLLWPSRDLQRGYLYLRQLRLSGS